MSFWVGQGRARQDGVRGQEEVGCPAHHLCEEGPHNPAASHALLGWRAGPSVGLLGVEAFLRWVLCFGERRLGSDRDPYTNSSLGTREGGG